MIFQLLNNNILSEQVCPTRLAYCWTLASSLGPFLLFL